MTSGDDTEVKIVFITSLSTPQVAPKGGPALPPQGPFLVSMAEFKPQEATRNTLDEAQRLALEYLQEPTEDRSRREKEAAAKIRAARHRAAISNPYLTGGRRDRRRKLKL